MLLTSIILPADVMRGVLGLVLVPAWTDVRARSSCVTVRFEPSLYGPSTEPRSNRSAHETVLPASPSTPKTLRVGGTDAAVDDGIEAVSPSHQIGPCQLVRRRNRTCCSAQRATWRAKGWRGSTNTSMPVALRRSVTQRCQRSRPQGPRRYQQRRGAPERQARTSPLR